MYLVDQILWYAIIETKFSYYLNNVMKENKLAVEWLEKIPKEKWTTAWDNEWRWGHMTTNLIETMNSMLKKQGVFQLCIGQLYLWKMQKYIVKKGREANDGIR